MVVTKECGLKSKKKRKSKEKYVNGAMFLTNTEYCDRCTHAATQATNLAQIKTERNQGLTRGPGGWMRVQLDRACLQMSNQVL
jgi:hypothetical protein